MSAACVVVPERIDETAAPAEAPVTVLEAKAYARITSSAEDASIDGWIESATRRVQERCDRQLLRATFKAYLPAFPVAELELRPAPLLEVLSVSYVDVDGAPQTIPLPGNPGALFSIVKPVGPLAKAGRIVLLEGESWPATSCSPEAVVIEFEAGYGDAAADVPKRLLEAVKAGVTEIYNYRENPNLDQAVTPYIEDFVLWRP